MARKLYLTYTHELTPHAIKVCEVARHIGWQVTDGPNEFRYSLDRQLELASTIDALMVLSAYAYGNVWELTRDEETAKNQYGEFVPVKSAQGMGGAFNTPSTELLTPRKLNAVDRGSDIGFPCICYDLQAYRFCTEKECRL